MLKDWRENLHLLPRTRLQRASPTAPLQLLHPAAPVQWTLQHKRTPKNWTIVWVHHVGLTVVQSIVTWPHYCLLAIVLEPTMSSSLNFGSRIKSLHSENVTDSVGSTSICDASPDNVYNLEPGVLSTEQHPPTLHGRARNRRMTYSIQSSHLLEACSI